jgi:hypothetical protein
MKHYYFSFSANNVFNAGLVQSSDNEFPLGPLQKHLLGPGKFITPRILFWHEISVSQFAQMAEAGRQEKGNSGESAIYLVQ